MYSQRDIRRSNMDKLFSLLALAPSPYTDQINTKLLHLLYANFFKSAFIIIVVALLLTYILWPSFSHDTLLFWLLGITILTLFRFIDTIIYFKNPYRNDYRHWHQHITLGVVLSALLWSAVPFLFLSDTDIGSNFFIATVMIGMGSGAITTLAADLRLSHVYLYALFLPLIYNFWQFDDLLYNVSIVLILLYFALVSSAARHFHATLVETYHTLNLYDTAREQLVANEKRLRMMFEQAPIGIFYYGDDMTILDCNTELEKIMKAPREKLVGLNLDHLPDSRPLDAMREPLAENKPAQYEGPYRTKIADLKLSVKIQMTPLIDDYGKAHGGLCMMEDKTREHAARQEVEFLSLHDPLTGLPNRKLLKERMQQLLKVQTRQHTFSALLFLDLDYFKQINDSLGHVVGDKILIETAERLGRILRISDTLSRLGGDEFVILLPQLSQTEEEAIHYAYEVAQKVHAALDEPFDIDGHRLFSSFSIGISLFNSHHGESNEILRRADMAMYQSKAEGRKRTCFYDTEMDQKMQSYIAMKKNLHHAIERNELSISFQPILHIGSDKVVAAEALLRWEHKGSLIPTNELIAIAEESSLISDIGNWIIERACQQISIWQKEHTFALDYISLNISARQLLETGFSDVLLAAIQRYDIAHTLLKLEITETALISNFDKAKTIIDRLNAEGVDFIIDDFGTGYSSLSYLKKLPFTALKIDQSFVQDMLKDREDEALIRAIIDIAEQFNYRIIAEGVEEEAQKAMLLEISPDIYYQGYFASRPMDATSFVSYLQNA